MISCIPKNMESQRVVNGLGVAKNKTYHSTSHCIKEKINPRPRKAYNVKKYQRLLPKQEHPRNIGNS